MSGTELSPEYGMHMSLHYIGDFDDYELIYHEAIDINIKMIFDEGKVECLQFHGTDKVLYIFLLRAPFGQYGPVAAFEV